MAVILKQDGEIAILRRANLVVSRVLSELKEMVKPGVTTSELDRRAAEITAEEGAQAAFLNYPSGNPSVPPFPGNICVSVNSEVVHGIPGERVLNDGDIVSVDYGAVVNGFIGDAAITIPVGEVSERAHALMDITQRALEAGITQCRTGNRVGDISHAVQKVVEGAGFGVVRDFVGHGVGRSMHEDPEIPNFGKPNRGRRLEKGMVIAIEPMVSAGHYSVRLESDGWTAVTADGSLSAHYEHSVAITDNEPYVLSRP